MADPHRIMEPLGKGIRFLSFVILFATVSWGYAQNDALFSKASDAYNAGNYQQAIDDYLQILDSGQHSAALYFNLGNSYYKLNQVAPSIYYYEKAQLLDPTDGEITNNLGYARNMALDVIEPLPETAISKLYSAITKRMSFDGWARLAVVFMVLFVILYIAYYLFRYSSKKRLAFVGSMVCLALALMCFALAFVEHRDFQNDRPAIVFSKETSVKSEPNSRGQEVFKLHEGTKVQVLDNLEDWRKIKIADGQTGWIPQDDIKPIKDF